MRFGIQTIGSEGDVRPLLALAAGLRAAGHDVTVSICGDSRVNYQAICNSFGLQIAPSPASLDFARMADRLSHQEHVDWSREFHRFMFLDDRREEQMFEIAKSLFDDNDVVISHYLSYPTKAAALGSGKPHVSVQLTHEHTPSGYRPCRDRVPNLGPRMNLIAWRELFQRAEIGLKEPFLRFWNRKGLPPFEHVWSLYFSDDLNLLGVSELICPPPPDWDQRHVVTGFLNLPPAHPAPRLSPPVEAFLAAGEPPVFMTFGSVQEIYPNSNLEHNIQLFIAAANQSGCRAVIQTSGADAAKYPSDTCDAMNDKIFFVDWIPYDEIFARSAMAVHHAGAGTCQLSLQNDCPSVLLPPTEHHLAFANELHRLGVAPPPLMRNVVTPGSLAARIDKVLSDSTYRQRAVAAGIRIRGEDGVRRAVDVITDRFGTTGDAGSPGPAARGDRADDRDSNPDSNLNGGD